VCGGVRVRLHSSYDEASFLLEIFLIWFSWWVYNTKLKVLKKSCVSFYTLILCSKILYFIKHSTDKESTQDYTFRYIYITKDLICIPKLKYVLFPVRIINLNRISLFCLIYLKLISTNFKLIFVLKCSLTNKLNFVHIDHVTAVCSKQNAQHSRW